MSILGTIFKNVVGDWTKSSFGSGLGSLITGGFGSLISGGISSLFGSSEREWRSREAEKQRQWQEQMMYKQNDLTRENQALSYNLYDSASAQRRGMEAAGMNPFQEGSALQSGVSSYQGANSPASPAGHPSGDSNVSGAVAGRALLDFMKVNAEIRVAESIARKNNADAQGSENQNSIFDPDVEKKLRSAIADEATAKATIAKIQAAYQEMKEIDDVAQRDAIYRRTVQEINNMVKQGKLTEEQANLVKNEASKALAEKGYIDEKTIDLQKTRPARIDALKGQAAASNASASVDNARAEEITKLVNSKKKEIDKRVQSMQAEIDRMDREQARKELEMLLRMCGADQIHYSPNNRVDVSAHAGLRSSGFNLSFDLPTGDLAYFIRRMIAQSDHGDAIKKLYKKVYGVEWNI